MPSRRYSPKRTGQSNVAQWLQELGLSCYASVFAENAIDWDVLSEITEADLVKLGILVGHRKRLMKAIIALAATTAAERGDALPQRRQLTVFFSDVVGSTELAARFDPEDLREILEQYRCVVVDSINKYDGHVAHFLGDGVLAYFGWPKAHENEAERALHSGMEVVSAVRAIDVGNGAVLRARVGIATGRVVVGQLGGAFPANVSSAFGETPNLAARLQTLAAEDQVVIDETTRSLVGDAFGFADLGRCTMKGFRTAVQVWRVVNESSADSRFETRGQDLTPFVDRERERERLLACWASTQEGQGQVVVISGEPGIGKSRLLSEAANWTRGVPHTEIHYQCSPYHLNSAYYPVVRQLERAARFKPNDSAASKRRKLHVLVRDIDGTGELASLLTPLLSIGPDSELTNVELSSQERKVRTYEALVEGLCVLARRRPVILFVEDLQWLDPTTSELLNRVVPTVACERVLVVLTHRPDWQPTFAFQSHVLHLTLNRLGAPYVRTLVRSVARDRIPEPMLDRIVARSDGIPLFAEELTHSVIDAKDGAIRTEEDIPETLEASLLSRFDRLGDVKEIAQAGAAIGREFEGGLLAKVTGLTEDSLVSAMQRCVASRLIVRREVGGKTQYSFKHALVQDVAYKTLLREARRDLHRRIADTLQEDYADAMEQRPEVLAHHLTEGGRLEEAVRFWQSSGEIAMQRSAHVEAASHFERALGILARFEPTAECRRSQLEVLIRYASTLRATKGFGNVATGEASAGARDLAEKLGDQRSLVPALLGVYSFHLVRGEHAASEGAARELLSVARAQQDDAYDMLGSRALGVVLLHLGRPKEAADLLERALGQYDESRDRRLALTYAADHATTCACFLSMARWLLGETGAAFERIEAGVQHAERLAHPFSLTQALVYLSLVQTLAHDRRNAATTARRAVQLAERHSFAHMRSLANFFSVAARLGRTDPRRVADEMQVAAEAHEGNFRPLWLTMCAEAHIDAGRPSAGLALISEAETVMVRTGERWTEAEMLRIRGELLWAARRNDEAQRSFDDAVAVARSQAALSWELRAAVSRARLLSTSDRPDALELLRDVRARFPVGSTSRDTIAADGLLAGQTRSGLAPRRLRS